MTRRSVEQTYRAARTPPVAVWDLLQGRVQAVRVVGGDAHVTAEQLAAVLTRPVDGGDGHLDTD